MILRFYPSSFKSESSSSVEAGQASVEWSPKATGCGTDNMAYVYVLKSLKNQRYYTGSTNDLNRRLSEHHRGQSKYTREAGPYKLVYVEEYLTTLDAKHREKFLKTGRGREELKIILLNGERE